MSLPRWTALPAAAVAAVVVILGVQIANGGGSYEPLQPRSACTERVVAPQSEGIEGLTESLVLTGLSEAACELGVSREELTLDLAQQSSVTNAQVAALRTGLHTAVDRSQDAGMIPSASELADEALAGADLNPLVERAIGLLPDSVVDSAVDVPDVLDRTIDSLDLRDVLTNLDDPGDLEDEINRVVTEAVKDSVVDRIYDLLP